MEIENLNHMTRVELFETLKVLPEGEGATFLALLLNGKPLCSGIEPGRDVFEISASPAVIEDISYGVERYAYAFAEAYLDAADEGETTDADEAKYYYWQVLSEKWSYLEVASGA